MNKLCEICNKNKANGSIGKLHDPYFIQWVCSYCYKNVLKMKSLKEIMEKNKSAINEMFKRR